MSEEASQLLEAVSEIRELLRLIAEPAIAVRDGEFRERLRKIVGTSARKRKSVFLMDGTHTQKQIRDLTSVNQGDLSTLVKKLNAGKLLVGDARLPKLAFAIPSNVFEIDAESK